MSHIVFNTSLDFGMTPLPCFCFCFCFLIDLSTSFCHVTLNSERLEASHRHTQVFTTGNIGRDVGVG